MSLIKAYSDSSAFATGGIWEPTAANFPKLAHLFKCNEATVGTGGTLTDSVGGLVLDNAGAPGTVAITNNADGSISFTPAMTAISSMSLAAHTGKKPIFIVIGKPASTNSIMTVGSVVAGTNKGYRMTGLATTYPASTDGATSVTGTATRTGTGAYAAYCLEVNYGSATGLALHTWDGTTWTDHATANISGQTAPAELDASFTLGTGTVPALIAILLPTATVDADVLKAGVQWMYHYASTSPYNKWIYPGFATI